MAILRKMSKQQQESIDMYRKGNREDLVEKEVKMQQMIDAMLPQVLLLLWLLLCAAAAAAAIVVAVGCCCCAGAAAVGCSNP